MYIVSKTAFIKKLPTNKCLVKHSFHCFLPSRAFKSLTNDPLTVIKRKPDVSFDLFGIQHTHLENSFNGIEVTDPTWPILKKLNIC